MKRYLSILLLAGAFVGLLMTTPEKGTAGVSINVTIPLPGLVFAAPPAMVVIPGTYVYYPPDAGVDIFFYQGSWYRPYQGGWYVSLDYSGPWEYIPTGRVPRILFDLPSGYRDDAPRYGRMPYRMVRRNWRAWEQERHGDRSERNYAYPRDGRFMPHRRHGMGRGMGMGREDDD